jgi:replicative superfamily II helicase
LTLEERAAVEQAFRDGTLAVLAATSGLAAGVNLPAGRVLILPAHFMDPATFRQMAGRAGRSGLDVAGDAFLVRPPPRPLRRRAAPPCGRGRARGSSLHQPASSA